MATAVLSLQRDETVAAAEWQTLVDLAALYRLAAFYGFDV